jgi:hypothetical protein
LNNKVITTISAVIFVALVTGSAYARDLGVLLLPIHQGKLTSSLMYENLKLQDDFDARGRSDFKSHAMGAAFSYGITDQVAVIVKGGTLINPEVDAQGSRWESSAGYLYGIDLYNEVFPATPGWRPGIQLSGGATGFVVPLDRTNVSGTWQTIDQKMSGYEYHGAVIATLKFGPTEPYAGVRGFAGRVTWQDNQSNPGVITGHEHGNISLVAGLPVQISKDVRFFAEGRFVNETAVTAGFTVASF